MTGFLDLVLQSFPPSSKFKVEDVPDLTGKVALVTGANTGVGLEIAKVRALAQSKDGRRLTGMRCQTLLSHNAKVYIASRNQEKCEAAIETLRTATGKDAVFIKLDLASLSSVAVAAKEFLRSVFWVYRRISCS